MNENIGYKAWIAILILFSALGWGLYLSMISTPESYDPDAEIDYWSGIFYRCEANYDALENDLAGCEFDLRGERIGAGADQRRVEFLEGQLESCNNAYSRELHDRLFYQNAFDNVSPYCSEGLYQLVIDGVREELYACQDQVINQRGYWQDAQTLCFQDKNCSACMEMTEGNLEHCFTYAYFP